MFYDGVNNRVQSNRQFTQDWRQQHKSSIEAEKNISPGKIGPYNTPKNCKSGKDSQQKFTCHTCSAHVLFPNNTSKKRQMQRQERTGHFHVNSKEWNIIYDGVNHRVQSNRQTTQDLQQWHKSSIEEKNISQGSIGPYNTPKQMYTGNNVQAKILLSNTFDPYVIPKHHKHKTPDAETGEEQVISMSTPKRSGTCFTMVWIIECKATDSLHKTGGNDTSLPSKQKKISHKEVLDLITRQNNCEPGKNRKKSPFNYVRPICYSQTSQALNARWIDRKEQAISTSTPKRSGTCFTMVWIIECKATDSLHKTGGNDTSLPSKQKKISHQEKLDLTTRQKTVNREKTPNKNSPAIHVRPMCYSQTTQAKNARCRDRREQVISTSTPRSGT